MTLRLRSQSHAADGSGTPASDENSSVLAWSQCYPIAITSKASATAIIAEKWTGSSEPNFAELAGLL